MEDDKHKFKGGCGRGGGCRGTLCAGQCPSGSIDGRALPGDVFAPLPRLLVPHQSREMYSLRLPLWT